MFFQIHLIVGFGRLRPVLAVVAMGGSLVSTMAAAAAAVKTAAALLFGSCVVDGDFVFLSMQNIASTFAIF